MSSRPPQGDVHHHPSAAVYWRDEPRRAQSNNARVINTTSASGIYANPGQSNYGAAKAGIAAFTQIVAQRARSLRRHGQRHRTRRPDPADRGPLARGAGAPELRTAVGRTGRHLAGLRAVGRCHGPGDRVVGPGVRGGRGLAPRAVGLRRAVGGRGGRGAPAHASRRSAPADGDGGGAVIGEAPVHDMLAAVAGR